MSAAIFCRGALCLHSECVGAGLSQSVHHHRFAVSARRALGYDPRLIAGPMAKALGQQIVVEDVTGAGGIVGTNRVAKALPDGYQLVISGSGTLPAAEFLHENLPYRSADFGQIGLINFSPVVLVARKAVPTDTLQDFIEYLRANERKSPKPMPGSDRSPTLPAPCSMRWLTCIQRSRHIAARPRPRGSSRRQRRFWLQSDCQYYATRQKWSPQGLCRDKRQAFAAASERSDVRRSGATRI